MSFDFETGGADADFEGTDGAFTDTGVVPGEGGADFDASGAAARAGIGAGAGAGAPVLIDGAAGFAGGAATGFGVETLAGGVGADFGARTLAGAGVAGLGAAGAFTCARGAEVGGTEVGAGRAAAGGAGEVACAAGVGRDAPDTFAGAGAATRAGGVEFARSTGDVDASLARAVVGADATDELVGALGGVATGAAGAVAAGIDLGATAVVIGAAGTGFAGRVPSSPAASSISTGARLCTSGWTRASGWTCASGCTCAYVCTGLAVTTSTGCPLNHASISATSGRSCGCLLRHQPTISPKAAGNSGGNTTVPAPPSNPSGCRRVSASQIVTPRAHTSLAVEQWPSRASGGSYADNSLTSSTSPTDRIASLASFK